MTTATQETLEILWHAWQRNLELAADHPEDERLIAPTQRLIFVSRELMSGAGLDDVAQHNFFATLLFHIRRERKHSSASQFVKFLQIETEFD